MTEPIHIEFRWDYQQFMAARRAMLDARMRPIFWWCIVGIGVLAVIVGPVLLASQGLDSVGAWVTLYGILVTGKCISTPWTTKRAFLRSGFADRLIRVTLAAEAMRYDVEGLSSSIMQWRMFSEVVSARQGILVKYGGSEWVWIPFSALKSEEDIRNLLGILQERIAAAASESPEPTS